MEKQDIENYIKQIKELDKQFNGDDDISIDEASQFVSNVNQVLESLTKNIEGEMKKSVDIGIVLPVKFKKLKPNAVTPTYAKDGDAGLDLTATDIISNTSYQAEYGTGIAVEIPR